jgi:hypothetical protein
VTRLGKILPFRLLFKGMGNFLEEICFVFGILRVSKVFDVIYKNAYNTSITG